MRTYVVQLLLITAICLTTIPVRAEKLVLVAGLGDKADNALATQVKLTSPFGVDFDRAGNLFLVEMAGGEHVRKMDKSGVLTIIAGTGEKGFAGDGGPALQAHFNGMHNLAVAPDGDVLLADTWNSRIRKIDAKTGVISTIIGTGKRGFSGDGGPATKADFGNIYCASLDPQGENLFLADLDNRRIRAVNLKTGLVRAVAGNGEKGVPANGAVATQSPLSDPRAVAADAKGNVYVLERGGNALRVVDAAGKIRTVVGNGQKGLSGDGGDARAATMNGPKHLCVDRAGDVIIADTENHVIRKYLAAEGKIIRVAGTGKKGTAGVGGPPEQAEFNQPHGVTLDAAGTLYIVDSSNNRVLRIER